LVGSPGPVAVIAGTVTAEEVGAASSDAAGTEVAAIEDSDVEPDEAPVARRSNVSLITAACRVTVAGDANLRGMTSFQDEPTTSQRQQLNRRLGPKAGVVSEHNKHNVQVKINDVCRVLVIGDSNLRGMTALPEDYQIECIPGAHLDMIARTIVRMNIPDGVQHIVIAAGINDRDEDRTTALNGLTQCLRAASETNATAHFLGVSFPDSMHESAAETLNAINERARSTYKRNYIPALRTDEVTTKRGDSVHYDRDTCAAIQDKIVAHFYSLN